MPPRVLSAVAPGLGVLGAALALSMLLAAPARAGDLADIGCDKEGQVSSAGCEPYVETTITFVNESGGAVAVYWLDYEGQRVFYFDVAPGGSATQETFTCHPWLVTDQSGGCLGIYVAEASPGRVTIGGRATNTPPELLAPARVDVPYLQDVSVLLPVADADGDHVTVRAESGLPAGSVLAVTAQGVPELRVAALRELAGQTAVVNLAADDGHGGVARAATTVRFLLPPGENPPTLVVPTGVVAEPGGTRAFVAIATDRDGEAVRLEADGRGAVAGLRVDAAGAGAFRVSFTVAESQRGSSLPVDLLATDAAGHTAAATVVVAVPPRDGVEVERFEVRWQEPQAAADPFAAPGDVEAFDAPKTFQPLADPDGPAADLEGYSVYVSDQEELEPSAQTLAAVVDASKLNLELTVTQPAGKTHRPFHVRVTARRRSGESRPSKDGSTDRPRFAAAPKYAKGKITIQIVTSNLKAGGLLEVVPSADAEGDRFALVMNRKGTKGSVKPSALSTTGARRLQDALRPGQPVLLLLVNPSGARSLPFPFVPQ